MKKLLTLLFTLVLTAGCILGLTACGDNNGSNGKQTITVYTESGFAPFEYLNENGEVVIPKEIRRTLRIREGDPSQMTLAPWENFCFGMLDLAKRRGW